MKKDLAPPETDNGGIKSAEKEEQEWYYRPWVIFLAFFVAGPLALILVWSRPRTNTAVKVFLTVLVLIFTVFMTRGAVDYYREMAAHIDEVAKVVDY